VCVAWFAVSLGALDGGCDRCCCCQPGVGTDETGASASADWTPGQSAVRLSSRLARARPRWPSLPHWALSKGSLALACCDRELKDDTFECGGGSASAHCRGRDW